MVAEGFFWILEMTVVNSYIIFQHTQREQQQKTITHLAFRRQLIESCRTTSVVSNSGGNFPVYQLRWIPHYLEKRHKHRDCVVYM